MVMDWEKYGKVVAGIDSLCREIAGLDPFWYTGCRGLACVVGQEVWVRLDKGWANYDTAQFTDTLDTTTGPMWTDDTTIGGLLMKYLPEATLEPDFDLDGRQVGWVCAWSANHCEADESRRGSILRAVAAKLRHAKYHKGEG